MKFREATRDDVPRIVAMLSDDILGQGREGADPGVYLQAFDRMQEEANNLLIVGEVDGVVAATYQLTFISGLSVRAARRAQIESIRVDAHLRGQGYGRKILDDAEARARAAGCTLLQLTTNATRSRARAFYERSGFTASHIGFKRDLV